MTSSLVQQKNYIRYVNCGMFALWFVVVLLATIRYAISEDEGRALSLAFHDGSVIDMIKAVHGEGHPLIWYFLLRGAHVLVPTTAVLKVVAFAVAAATAVLVVFLSPFSRWIVALILAGNVFLFEYSVVARNYGIGALTMFLFAAAYNRHRERGFVLGIILLLMANCHVLTATLVAAYLFFWFVDTIIGDPAHRRQRLKVFFANVPFAVLGIVVCFLTVYPTFNEAAVNPSPGPLSTEAIANIIFAMPTYAILDYPLNYPSHYLLSYLPFYVVNILPFFIMFISTLGLVRRPAAWVTAVSALLGLSLFFVFVYSARYRHAAIWLVFLISLYWIVSAAPSERKALPRIAPYVDVFGAMGWLFFALFLTLQVPQGVRNTYMILEDRQSNSSRDLGAYIDSRPDLKDAIVLSNCDYLIQSLLYYTSNPTYVLSEHRFGRIALLTKSSQKTISLDDVLKAMQDLHAQNGKPVLLLVWGKLRSGLDPSLPPKTYGSCGKDLTVTPEQVSRFLPATRFLKGFAPTDDSYTGGYSTEEIYDLYELRE